MINGWWKHSSYWVKEKSHSMIWWVSSSSAILLFLWCSFRLFDEKKDVLILVFLEEIPTFQLSPFYRMRKMLKRRTYLSWPRAGEHTELFWKKLCQALKSGEDHGEDRFRLTVVDRPWQKGNTILSVWGSQPRAVYWLGICFITKLPKVHLKEVPAIICKLKWKIRSHNRLCHQTGSPSYDLFIFPFQDWVCELLCL